MGNWGLEPGDRGEMKPLPDSMTKREGESLDQYIERGGAMIGGGIIDDRTPGGKAAANKLRMRQLKANGAMNPIRSTLKG